MAYKGEQTKSGALMRRASSLTAADPGVTSVLGTAITVGVAVALAFGLLVMLRTITDRDIEKTPETSITRDEQTDSLTFLVVQPGQIRGGYEIRLSVPGDFEFNAVPSDNQPAVAADQFALMGGNAGGPADGPLNPSDRLVLCSSGTDADDVEVSIRHVESNKMIYRETFLKLNACPP